MLFPVEVMEFARTPTGSRISRPLDYKSDAQPVAPLLEVNKQTSTSCSTLMAGERSTRCEYTGPGTKRTVQRRVGRPPSTKLTKAFNAILQPATVA